VGTLDARVIVPASIMTGRSSIGGGELSDP
jgi:hypothetical protein